MNSNRYLPLSCMLVIFLFPFYNSLYAQTNQKDLATIILQKDSLFWLAYNTCDTASYPQFLTDDVEFYHDKGGITLGLENLIAITKKNLCSNNDFRLRREAVKGSIQVFPLQNSGVTYGAILSGEHVFYILEKGKKDRLDGLAKFTHLWLLKDGDWKMARILSYDHKPAPYINKRKEIKLPLNALNQFAGTYIGPKAGAIKVKRENDVLSLLVNNNEQVLYAESGNLFFTKERDLTFEFIKGANGKVSKIVVRENGEIVEEAKLVK